MPGLGPGIHAFFGGKQGVDGRDIGERSDAVLWTAMLGHDGPRFKGYKSRKGFSMSQEKARFWRTKTMAEMTKAEWESLCDGCGRCCLNKLIDEDTNQTVYTDVGCRLLDGEACRCSDYAHRQSRVKDCVRLTPRNVKRLTWLPPTCGYRLVANGQDLKWWHPLVSGDPETVHTAGISVRGRVTASEKDVPDKKLEEYIVSWPGKWPKGAKRKPQ
jgi:uncharacterized cysteine cluster protein YcgN (CxxCxxCC family)